MKALFLILQDWKMFGGAVLLSDKFLARLSPAECVAQQLLFRLFRGLWTLVEEQFCSADVKPLLLPEFLLPEEDWPQGGWHDSEQRTNHARHGVYGDS